MAWRNLRSEISEMFTEYSRGEELSEFTQQLWAARRATARANYLAYMKPYIKQWRLLHPEKVRAYRQATAQRKRLRAWAAEPERICRHCWQSYRRPPEKRPTFMYCSDRCRDEARKAYLAQHHARHYDENRAKTIERQKRWYQANREKVLAQEKAKREVRTAQERARYHAKRAAQKATQP